MVFIITITGCDYYNAAREYEDNNVLEMVDAWDFMFNNQNTPIAFELEGRCFFKKNDTWVLLNGKSEPKVRTLSRSGNSQFCLSSNDIEWASRICSGISKYDQELLMREFVCNGVNNDSTH
jgi:hypothetical protein